MASTPRRRYRYRWTARFLEDFAASRIDIRSSATYDERLRISGAGDLFIDLYAFVRSPVGARMVLDEAERRSALYPTNAIRRVANATPETVRRAWDRSEPVVLVGAAPEAEPWTPARLRNELGALRVLKSYRGVETIALSDYVDGVLDGTLTTSGGFALPKEMEAGCPRPSVFAVSDVTRPLGFLGAPGSITALHRDVPNAASQQVFGQKQWTLFPAHQAPLLYPRPRITWAQQCEVDFDAPDLAKHPLFAEATPCTVVLSPGEILLTPSGWFHHVRALTPSISVTWVHRELMDEALTRMRNVQRVGAG